MKFAVIGDIHSNQFALSAVLNDIKMKNVDAIFSTGDLVGYLPHPNEVIDMIRNHHVVSVKGNHDEAIAKSEKLTEQQYEALEDNALYASASRRYTTQMMSAHNISYLKQLPNVLMFEIEQQRVMIVHGSHRHNAEYIYEKDVTEQLMIDLPCDILITGHTHIPFHKQLSKKHVINVGSVGKPKTGDDLATYTIIEVTNDSVSRSLEKVSYDLTPLIEAINQTRGIDPKLIDNIKNGF